MSESVVRLCVNAKMQICKALREREREGKKRVRMGENSKEDRLMTHLCSSFH